MMLSIGARCWVLLDYLYPSKEVDKAFPNKVPKQLLDDLIVVCKGTHTRQGKPYPAVWFSSKMLPGVALLGAL